MDKVDNLIKELKSIINTLNKIESTSIDNLESAQKDIILVQEKIKVLNEEYSTETDTPEA